MNVRNNNNQQWVNENLHQQRLLLEERQRQRRLQSGAIRTSHFDSTSLSNSSTLASTPPLIDFSSTSPTPLTHSMKDGGVQGVPESTRPPYFIGPLDIVDPDGTEDSRPDTMASSFATLSVNDAHTPEDERCEGSAAVGICSRRESNGMEEHTLPLTLTPQYDEIQADVNKFVCDPAPQGVTFRCVITRDKRGMDKGMYPSYYLHLERDANRKIFLLAARKRKKCKTANYLLSTDATDLSREGGGYVAKVRSNALGTQFTLYDAGKNPKKTDKSEDVRAELASITYDPNVLGFRGPRKMTILIPAIENESKTRVSVRPISEKDSLVQRAKNRQEHVVRLHNKAPVWSEDSQSFVLNFHGRVTQASVKNFQIVHANDEDYVVMQFGRVNADVFSMDFRFPMSATQAFGVAMSSFHSKLACE